MEKFVNIKLMWDYFEEMADDWIGHCKEAVLEPTYSLLTCGGADAYREQEAQLLLGDRATRKQDKDC